MAGRNCRECGKPFVWAKNEAGKWRPADPKGGWHACPHKRKRDLSRGYAKDIDRRERASRDRAAAIYDPEPF